MHIIYLLTKKVEVKLNYSFPYRILNIITMAINVIYYFLLNHSRKPKHISKYALRILKNIDYDSMINLRKQHIKKIYTTLTPVDFLFFRKNLNSNYMLTGVPIISENFEEIINWLQKKNIECLSYKKAWFFMPEGANEEFFLESERFRTHFLLPIHEDNTDYSEVLVQLIKEKFTGNS